MNREGNKQNYEVANEGGQMSCQQAQHVKLSSDLLEAETGGPFDSPLPPRGAFILLSTVPHRGNHI